LENQTIAGVGISIIPHVISQVISSLHIPVQYKGRKLKDKNMLSNAIGVREFWK
jgi:hypothetical protein